MNRSSLPSSSDAVEQLVAELAVAAHSVALQYRPDGSFVDLQMALWNALRAVVAEEVVGEGGAGELACCFASTAVAW